MNKKWVKLIVVMTLVITMTSFYSMNVMAADETTSSTVSDTKVNSEPVTTSTQAASDQTATDQSDSTTSSNNSNRGTTAAITKSNDNSAKSGSQLTTSNALYDFTSDWTKTDDKGQTMKYNYIDSDAETFVNSSFYNSSLALGIAGNFAIVGYSEVHNTAHTNGNILTANLYNGANFGCKQDVKQVSYIQKYTGAPNAGEAPENYAGSDLLVVGNGVSVGLVNNNNSFSINGTKLDSPYNVAKDSASKQYIDMAAAKNESVSISKSLSAYPAQGVTSADTSSDHITLTNDTTGHLNVYNTTAASFTKKVNVKLSDTNGTSTLINIDANGAKTVTIPGLSLYVNGIQLNAAETGDYNGGKVLINVYDSSSNDGLFHGTVEVADATYSSILAPEATINIRSNVNGSIIGDILNISGETHQTNFTGTLKPEAVSKTVKKVWNDNDNAEKVRPTSIKAELYANGSATGKTVTLDESNNWTYTWTGLDKDKDGKDITYTVKELDAKDTAVENNGKYDDNYTTTYTEEGSTTTITNKHESKPATETVSKTVKKIWSDSNNSDSLRPAGVQVQLYADGVTSGTAVTLNSGNDWSYTWGNLDKTNSNGKEIKYTVQETIVPSGYTATYSDDTFTITNTHTPTPTPTPEMVSKSVKKVWDDSSNKNNSRPASVTVQLYANGHAYGDAVTLTSSNQTTDSNTWGYTWNNLPKQIDGQNVTYTVQETSSAAGYEASYSDDTFTITNTYINKNVPEKISKTVKKIWNDSNNTDGSRPAGVQVQLYADGVTSGTAVTLNSVNNWTYTWDNLDKTDSNGKEIKYTVQETIVPNGYTASYSDDTFNITNTHTPTPTPTPETVSKSVKKVWDDNSNKNDARPASVTVQLYANGQTYGDAVTLTSSNQTIDSNTWGYTWNSLPKQINGQDVTYTVQETSSAAGYEANYSDDTFTITNTYLNKNVSGKTSKTVKKVWKDDNNSAGKRPSSIKVQLYAGNDKYGSAVTLDAANGWKYTWNGLSKVDSNGNEITYRVVETSSVAGYEASYSDDSFTITNTYLNHNSHHKNHNNNNNNNNGNGGSGNIDTGDMNNMALWISLGITSLFAAIATIALRRKQNQ